MFGDRESGEQLLSEYGVFLGAGENILELDRDGGYKDCECMI